MIIWSASAVTAPETAGQIDATTPTAQPIKTTAVISNFQADSFYDAGDLGCAFGPLDEIAKEMRTMSSGQTLEIRATDPTVSVDLAAWCRMTGNSLVDQAGDRYLVRKK
jgi:TusA-related sulfurtransferase